jgi:hypothetical protein
MANVQVSAVFWGPNVSPALTADLPGFLQTIVGSDYIGWLDQYDTTGFDGGSGQHISPGTYGQTVTIAPVDTDTTLMDSDIAVELSHQISIGVLPAPRVDASGSPESLYMVFFPSSFRVTYGTATSCVGFAGYHSSASAGSAKFAYAVIPDCGLGIGFIETPTSHELAESITDPLPPQAWYLLTQVGLEEGEIGDLCKQSEPYLGHTVQQLWSNAHLQCQVLPPVCNGTNAPCRQCTAADEENGADNGCSGVTAYCATDPTDPKVGTCVACSDSTQCPGTTPICDRTLGDQCRACATSSECPAGRSVCLPSGACVECTAANAGACTGVACLANTDCGGSTPFCSPSSGVCVACLSSNECSGVTPICNPVSSTCRACTADVECAPGVCDVASDAEQGACVACNVDAQCGEGMICTPAHACGACTTTSGCNNPTPVCAADSSTCRGCASDADCAGNIAGPVCVTQGPMSGSCVVGDASTDDAGARAGGAGAGGGGGGGCTVGTTARSPRGCAALLVGASLVARRRRRMRR